MPQAIYLDSQSLAYLLGQPVFTHWTQAGTDTLHTAVDEALRTDRIVICGSQFHLEEASRIPNDRQARTRFMQFFWERVKWFLLLPTRDLGLLEAKLRRPLEATEPYEEFWRRRHVRQLTQNAAGLDRLAQDVESFVDNGVINTEARRNAARQVLRARYANLTVPQATQRWWAKADSEIEDWVQSYIAASTEHLGLSDDENTWPHPRDLQTAWAIHAYNMARIVKNVGLGEAIGDGDPHDAHHYASACYADLFVTQDDAFRRTMAIIPNSPVTVVSFNEFAAQFGIQPH